MTLRLKILGAMALVLAVSVGGSFVGLMRYHRAQRLRNIADATSDMADLIRATLDHAMLANDREEIQQVLLTVGNQPGIEGVYVLDHAGVVRVASRPDRVGRPLDGGRWGLPPHSALRDMPESDRAAILPRRPSAILRNARPIRNAPQCGGCHSPAQQILGALVMDRSLGPMERELRASLAYMLGSAGLTFLLLTATTYAVLRRLVVAPLANLGRAARAIEAGNYDTPMTLQRADEVGDLGRTLDQMRRRILDHLEEVRRWGKELEARVAERTLELRTLHRVALVTNEAPDLPAVCARALEAALDALGVEGGAIVLAAPEGGEPLVVQRGLGPAEVEAIRRQAKDAGPGCPCVGPVGEGDGRAFGCFPIRSKGALRGVLCAHSPGGAPLASEKRRLLEALASQLGGAMERAILHHDLERSFGELRDSQAQVIERERQIAALEAVRAATVTLSHHINNATAGIDGCRAVLAMTLGDQADWQVRYALDGIHTSVKRISAVLRALGEVTRIQFMPFPDGVQAIDVERAIQETLARIGPAEPPGGQDSSDL